MPQFKIRIKNLDTNLVDHISVWAEDLHQANVKALKLASTLLGTNNLELQDAPKSKPIKRVLYECAHCGESLVRRSLAAIAKCNNCGKRMKRAIIQYG